MIVYYNMHFLSHNNDMVLTIYKDARLKIAVESYGNNWVKVVADVGGDVTGPA
jgi:hypothetical protein